MPLKRKILIKFAVLLKKNNYMHTHFNQVDFTLFPYEEYLSDLLCSSLGEIAYDTFVPTENGVEAYIESTLFDEQKLAELVANFNFNTKITYQVKAIESKNWNEEWEKHYFEPIIINDKCVIHSTFHKNIPLATYDIVIDPKMAFGTGHHETTSLMIGEILTMNLAGKALLDMGCGTSVLAILASMRGAKPIVAIDIDTWCTENSEENIRLNNIEGIEVLLGGAELLQNRHFDVVLANINRNILLQDMATYAACLSSEGELYMSGFYREDIPLIEAEANNQGLKLTGFHLKNNWAVVKTIKI